MQSEGKIDYDTLKNAFSVVCIRFLPQLHAYSEIIVKRGMLAIVGQKLLTKLKCLS